MSKVGAFLLLQGIATLASANAQAQDTGFWALVEVGGFRDQSGMAAIAVCNRPEGFPENPAGLIAAQFVPIVQGRAQLWVRLPGPGNYAAAAYHDRNANGRLDQSNFLGVPTGPAEPWGVSGGARPKFRAPTFNEAAFWAQGEGSITMYVQ